MGRETQKGGRGVRRIYTYYDGAQSPVRCFFEKANAKIKDKFMFCMKYVKDDKNCFGKPYVKHFSGGKFSRLFEVRIMAIGKMVRVIFYEPNGDITLLYAFYKRTHKDTKDALAASLKILDKISDGEGAVLEKHREKLILND